MTPEEINLIQQNFEQVALQPEAVATAFYQRLFALNPVLQQLFPADLSEQKKKLIALFGFLIFSLFAAGVNAATLSVTNVNDRGAGKSAAGGFESQRRAEPSADD